MKIFLTFLLTAALATSALAISPFKGKYYALSYSGGEVVAAMNLKVKGDGTIKGAGYYVDLSRISLTGHMNTDGSFTINEASATGGQFSGKLNSAGTTFTATLSTGNRVVGTRIATSVPQAGLYQARLDIGLSGLFIVSNSRVVTGGIYNPATDEVIGVSGVATRDGFSGTTSDGVHFVGTFNGNQISGTYSDGQGFDGRFSGSKP